MLFHISFCTIMFSMCKSRFNSSSNLLQSVISSFICSLRNSFKYYLPTDGSIPLNIIRYTFQQYLYSHIVDLFTEFPHTILSCVTLSSALFCFNEKFYISVLKPSSKPSLGNANLFFSRCLFTIFKIYMWIVIVTLIA